MDALGNESVLEGRWKMFRTLVSNNDYTNNTNMDDYDKPLFRGNTYNLRMPLSKLLASLQKV